MAQERRWDRNSGGWIRMVVENVRQSAGRRRRAARRAVCRPLSAPLVQLTMYRALGETAAVVGLAPLSSLGAECVNRLAVLRSRSMTRMVLKI